jgi:DNA polymerase III delta prime subunit
MSQKTVKDNVLTAVNKKNLPQTILFYGPSDKSIFNLVNSFAQTLIKPKREIDFQKFIDLCSSQSFPDFITLSKGSTGSIKIEDVLALDNIICYQPYESDNRIIFIRDAGTLTPQAQNALLKKIEEPPARTYFILSANKKNSLLPTIVSRSIAIFVPPEKSDNGEITPFDFFTFLEVLGEEIGLDSVMAEKKKMEMETMNINPNSLGWIDKMAEIITDISNMAGSTNDVSTAEKTEYHKRMYIRMRLAFFSFYIKNRFPDVSLRIAQFLKNNQYFSFDASVFYNIIGDEIGKEQ